MDTLKLYIETITNNKNTANSYRKDIESMLDFVDKKVEDINEEDLVLWKESIKCLSNATVSRRIGSVKRYFNFLYEHNFIVNNPTKFLKPPTVKNKEQTPLTPDEIKDMLNASKNPRDRAIFATLISTGMRISELINIKKDDIIDDNVKIIGKGGKQRLVHFNEQTMNYIKDYLRVRKNGVDNLFVSDHRTAMNAQSINNTLKCIARRAGINNPSKVHNHLCRTTNATLALQHGVPVENIQICLGHANIGTTMRYAKILNENDIIKSTMDIQLF